MSKKKKTWLERKATKTPEEWQELIRFMTKLDHAEARLVDIDNNLTKIKQKITPKTTGLANIILMIIIYAGETEDAVGGCFDGYILVMGTYHHPCALRLALCALTKVSTLVLIRRMINNLFFKNIFKNILTF